MRPLSLLEARVLGVLVEKAHTVPDSYPLSLNALTLGSNQKTAREPVLAAERRRSAGSRPTRLRALSLVVRVERVAGHALRAQRRPRAGAAVGSRWRLLATLMLRGPQTTSELRSNSERLHRFADLSSVEGFLEELATRGEEKGGPVCVKLARAAGAREPRWAHLMSGPVEMGTHAVVATNDEDIVASGELSAVKSRLAAVEAETSRLRQLVERLCGELDIKS